MSIFTTTIPFKTEDIRCYYLCKHTLKIFKEKRDESHSLMISKIFRENEMILICKDCCDLSQKVFSTGNGDFCNETKKSLVRYY